jgi:hypothetical protein
MIAWHFLKSDRKLAYPPHTPVFTGQRLTVDPDRMELRVYGLHASERALDALKYAPGPIVCRVRLGGRILTGEDKLCASERTVIAMADATGTLRAFARACALDVIDNWNAPAVVREYLETGNEDLRIAAWSAASAAESAAESVARSVARSAASARSAAWSAAGAAAAAEASESAAWSAARSVAWLAAESAWSAARSVAESKQNKQFEAMLFDLLQLQG